MEKDVIKRGLNIKIIAGLTSFLILVALLLSGSAQAVILKLIITNKNVEKGELLNFVASVKLVDEQLSDLKSIILRLNGPIDVECNFKPDGTIIKGCKGITIEKIPDGYGYNPDEKELKYNIIIDTTTYFAGTYLTSLYAVINEQTFRQLGGNININVNLPKSGTCSIRAINGNLTVGEKDFASKNKLTFYSPIDKASRGQGSLSAQTNKERLVYNFHVTKIVENDKFHTVIAIQGSYRIGRSIDNFEKSVIVIDKLKNKVSIIGKNVNVEYMDVDLKAGCLA